MRYVFLFAAIKLLLLSFGCVPHDYSKGYLSKGVASWYGPKFHGNPTASGEIYDMNKLTAAHRTLPFGTVVKVVNMDNKKEVTVKINDRGPFVKGRIIDLSRKAAEKIDMMSKGTSTVTLYIVKRGSGQRVIDKGDYRFFAIQIGAFETKKKANILKKQVSKTYIKKINTTANFPFKVLYGEYDTYEDAYKMVMKLRGRKFFKDAFIIRVK